MLKTRHQTRTWATASALLLLVGCQSTPVDPIDSRIANMSLEQKVGQMIQAEIKHISPEQVAQYGIGSILNGGGSFPNNDKQADPADWLALAQQYRTASLQSDTGIPIIWGTDAVHGHNNVMGATLFPHNIGLGATRNAQLVQDIAAATARSVAATGIDWIFAPTVAVATDYRWGRTYESYSSDPVLVAELGAAAVRGIEGEGVAATAKHFIGDGATHLGKDQGDAILDLDQLIDEHGQGYKSTFTAGVKTVMASFNSWNGNKVHGSRELLTDVLRDQLGFEGMVVSDWNGIGQVKGCQNDDCAQAINAGIDLIMVPEDWQKLMSNTIAQVKQGAISEERIDQAVERILRLKQQLGLFGQIQRPATSVIGSEQHIALARQAVQESAVLLKNNSRALPLNPQQRILVLGDAADNIGQLAGGWTLTWQGTGNQNHDFPGAESILAGIQRVVGDAGGEVITAQSQQTPDAVVVVFGETPYAEGVGDLKSLVWPADQSTALAQAQQYRQRGIPVISIFISGRPLWVNQQINQSDAFIAAWLPGTQAGALADVLFGRSDFRGKLPFAWPNLDLNAKDPQLAVDDFLFPLGYGLSYQNSEQLETLNEQGIGFHQPDSLQIFARDTRQPWQLFLGDTGNYSQVVNSAQMHSSRQQISVQSIDYQVQEDARQFTWKAATNLATAFWQSTEPQDFIPWRNSDAALVINWRVDQYPDQAVELRMDCGYPCRGSVAVQNTLRAKELGMWTKTAVPLRCFEKLGARIDQINTPLAIATQGNLRLSISEITITNQYNDLALAACSGEGH